MRPSLEPWPVRRHVDGALGPAVEDALVAEEPLEIRLNGRALVVTMRTPGDEEDLAVGFLHNEGILRDDAAVATALVRNPLDEAHHNIVNVRVDESGLLRAPASRSFHASSACGVCGQASLDDMARSFPRVSSTLRVRASVLTALPAAMREAQAVFARTGALHAAALFDADGSLLALREDVGRHNAVDKLTGWARRERRLPLSDAVLAVSGRAGYEIVQKAVASGIPVVAAVGAPTTLAARLAHDAGVTLVGFLKDRGFNCYAHEGRIVG